MPPTRCSSLLHLLRVRGLRTDAGVRAGARFRVLQDPRSADLLAERPGHARCIACHGSGTPLRLQPLAAGQTTWTDEESRKNFDAVRRLVVPGSAKSRLLIHPLAESAGGDFYHNGGKHWSSQNDVEWLTIKAWVMGNSSPPPPNAIRGSFRPTAPATTCISSIPPPTRWLGSFVASRPATAPAPLLTAAGSTSATRPRARWISSTRRSLAILKKVPLSGHPNNMAVSKDGGRVYVGIAQAPGGVDVIDTASMQRVKTVPTEGTIHNAYVTPDGRFVVAGSIPGGDDHCDRCEDRGTGVDAEDGSGYPADDIQHEPRRIDEVDLHATDRVQWLRGRRLRDAKGNSPRRRIHRCRQGKMTVPQGSDPSHGMAVTADGKTLVVCSRLNNYLYSYSLPDLKLVGSAELGGKGAGWVTLTPDGKTAYVANPVTNDVSVVDIASMKETTRIPVGFVPKRNVTVSLQ